MPAPGLKPADPVAPVSTPGNGFSAFFDSVSKSTGVPLDILKSVQQQETPNNDPAARSKDDARGLMQVRPGAAKDVGIPWANLDDPETGILAGGKYLKQLFDRFGDWGKAVQAYHQGPTAVSRGDPQGPINKKYVADVMGRLKQEATAPTPAPAPPPSYQAAEAPQAPANPWANIPLKSENTWQDQAMDFAGGLWELAKAIKETPTQMAGSIAAAIRGGEDVHKKTFGGDVIAGAARQAEELIKEGKATADTEFMAGITYGDIQKLPQNLGYSITAALSALPALPIAVAPVPGARPAAWLAATGLAGTTAYRPRSCQPPRHGDNRATHIRGRLEAAPRLHRG
jgi:hypothetical protein